MTAPYGSTEVAQISSISLDSYVLKRNYKTLVTNYGLTHMLH